MGAAPAGLDTSPSGGLRPSRPIPRRTRPAFVLRRNLSGVDPESRFAPESEHHADERFRESALPDPTSPLATKRIPGRASC